MESKSRDCCQNKVNTSSELMCIKSLSLKEQTLLGRNDDECHHPESKKIQIKPSLKKLFLKMSSTLKVPS